MRAADRVRGRDHSADDYLVKPFALGTYGPLQPCARRPACPVITYGALTLDPATPQGTWQGQPVELSGRACALLQALLDRPGAVLACSQLEERLYGWEDAVGSHTVERHMHHLRRQLIPALMHHVRGVGSLVSQRV